MIVTIDVDASVEVSITGIGTIGRGSMVDVVQGSVEEASSVEVVQGSVEEESANADPSRLMRPAFAAAIKAVKKNKNLIVDFKRC